MITWKMLVFQFCKTRLACVHACSDLFSLITGSIVADRNVVSKLKIECSQAPEIILIVSKPKIKLLNAP